MDLIDLTELLDRSRATDEFKADVIALAEHRPAPRVELARHAPRVKVLRVLAQLASAEPEFAVDFVRVDGLSGCSDFRGVLVARSADGVERTFEFLWDCQWRALQEGWTDYFGLPDQIRAARAFGWQCFATWAERAAPVEAMSRG
jgi:hypothetical protein